MDELQFGCADDPVPDQYTDDDKRTVTICDTYSLNLDKDDPYIEENAMIIEEILKPENRGYQE